MAAGHNLELMSLRRPAAGPAGAAPVTIGKARASDGVRCTRHHHSRNLLRATSGNGSSLACIVIGVSYLRAIRGMCRTHTEEKPAYMPPAGAKLLPNRRSFRTEVSLWHLLFDPAPRSRH